MNDDKELLELAAQANEICGVWHTPKHSGKSGIALKRYGKIWNPLEDDGDALRLAVKLDILMDAVFAEATEKELYGNDPYAATRRAIVRAAAKIGRTR